MSRARNGEEISPIYVFDAGIVESRVREVTQLIIGELVEVDLKRHAKECRQKFEPVSPYPLNDAEIQQKFGNIARQQALDILEIERKNVVDSRTPYIKKVLETYVKQLRYVLLDDGKPFKTYSETSWCPDYTGTSMEKRVTSYSRSQIIQRWDARLAEFSDFRPYLNAEVEALWKIADVLRNQEGLVSKENLNAIEKTAKTEKAEVQEAT